MDSHTVSSLAGRDVQGPTTPKRRQTRFAVELATRRSGNGFSAVLENVQPAGPIMFAGNTSLSSPHTARTATGLHCQEERTCTSGVKKLQSHMPVSRKFCPLSSLFDDPEACWNLVEDHWWSVCPNAAAVPRNAGAVIGSHTANQGLVCFAVYWWCGSIDTRPLFKEAGREQSFPVSTTVVSFSGANVSLMEAVSYLY